MYAFATRLAWIAAFALPLGETWRRWGALWVEPTAYLDDIVLGVMFLLGAWMSRRGEHGRRWLAAAYGCAVGIMSLSLIGGIQHMAETDPAGVSGTTAVVIKLLMMALTLVGLLSAIGADAKRA